MNNLKGSSELTHDITITNEQISRVEDNEIARYCWEDDQLSTRSEKRHKRLLVQVRSAIPLRML